MYIYIYGTFVGGTRELFQACWQDYGNRNGFAGGNMLALLEKIPVACLHGSILAWR